MIYEYEPQSSQMAATRNKIRQVLNSMVSYGDQGVETVRSRYFQQLEELKQYK